MATQQSISGEVQVKLKPIRIPNFVLVDSASKDDVLVSSYPLAAIDAETLEQLCEDFTNRVFEKAGKTRPSKD